MKTNVIEGMIETPENQKDIDNLNVEKNWDSVRKINKDPYGTPKSLGS